MLNSRRTFTKEFKTKIVKLVQSGESVAVLARRHELHPNQIYNWVRKYRRSGKHAFDARRKKGDPQAERLAELERKVGQLTMENDFLKKLLQNLNDA